MERSNDLPQVTQPDPGSEPRWSDSRAPVYLVSFPAAVRSLLRPKLTQEIRFFHLPIFFWFSEKSYLEYIQDFYLLYVMREARAGSCLGNNVISSKILLTVAKLPHATFLFLCACRKLQCTREKNLFHAHLSGSLDAGHGSRVRRCCGE